MNYHLVNQILVVRNEYLFDPDSMIIFSKMNPNESIEKVINDFQQNKPFETRLQQTYPKNGLTQKSILPENEEQTIEKDLQSGPECKNVNLELHVTDRCTFRCKYCYAENACNQSQTEAMSEEILEQSLKFARNSFPNADFFSISLFGGEPLLYFKKFPFLIKKAREIFESKKYEISFPTNGSLIDDEIAQLLKENHISFQISWDGTEDSQNFLRPTKAGKKSFPIVNANLSRFAKISDVLSVRATITPYNMQLAELFSFFKQKGFKKVHYAVCYSGPDDIVIKEKHFSQLTKEWERLARVYLQHIIDENQIIELTPFRKYLRTLHFGKKAYYFCGRGKNLFVIAPNGMIYACHRFVRDETYRIGSITKGFDEKAKSCTCCSVVDQENCRDCFGRFLCGGGCLHDKTYGSFSLSCAINRHIIALCVWMYGELSVHYPKALEKLFPSAGSETDQK